MIGTRAMYRFVVCIFGLSLAVYNVDALRCYQCSDLDRGPCFNPTSTNGTIETCTSQQLSRNFPLELQEIFSFSESEARSSGYSAGDIRCFHYQTRQHLLNRTEVHRGCLTVSNADLLCHALHNNAQLLFYNVTTCRTCNYDLCNSSTRFGATFIGLSSFLTIIYVFNKFH